MIEDTEQFELRVHLLDQTFSGFLTAVILSLELMNMSHRGHNEAFRNLFRAEEGEGKRKLNWPVLVVNLVKVCAILFCATLSVWTIDDPATLSVSGLAVVVAISITRVLNHILINRGELVEEVTERFAVLARRIRV